MGLRFPDKRPAFPNSLSSFGLLFGDPLSLSVWEAPWVLLMCMALEATFCRSSGLSHPPPPPALCPAQTPRTEPGSMGREHPRVVGFQSDSMSSGEKQLLADVFHGVLLKFFVTCMSVPIFPVPVGAAEHWGPAAEVVGGAGCAGRGLWGLIPAAVGPNPCCCEHCPCCQWPRSNSWEHGIAQCSMAAPTISPGAIVPCTSLGYFKCL